MDTSDPPLDEQVFFAPSILAAWGTNHLNINNIHFYFSYSPFFDRTSNNAVLLNQSQYNPALHAIVNQRHTFEAHLRTMAGLEFVVTHDPSKNGTLPPTAVTGPWTIRKQIRRKGAGPKGEDALDMLADYFVVGERVFMAPMLASVLASRMLATAKALNGLVGKVGECVEYEPARGHGYPALAAASAAARDGKGDGSRGTTPALEMFDADDDELEDGDMKHETALLAETFLNHARYGKEYMDEHPLVGEPGNFIIQKANEVQVPVGALSERKGIALPSLTVKTDLASAVNKREKGGDKSPLSPTGTGATKKRKKDKKGQTPKEPKTPGA